MIDAFNYKNNYRKLIEDNLEYCLTDTSLGFDDFYQQK